MQCREVHTRLAAGNVDAAVRAHLDTCEACRTLADAPPLRAALEDERRGAAVDLDALWQGTRAQLRRDAHWSRAMSELPTGQRALLLVLGLAALPLLAGLVAARADLALYPPAELSTLLLGSVAVAAFSVWLGVHPIYRPPLPPALHAAVVVAALGFAWQPVWWPALGGGVPFGATGADGATAYKHVLGCFAKGAVVGVALLALLAMTLRGSGGLRRLPVVAFGVAGLAGTLTLQLHCPLGGAMHVAVGHSGAVMLFLLAALWLRPRPVGD